MALPGIEWIFIDLGETLIDERKVVRQRFDDAVAAMADLGRECSVAELEPPFYAACAAYATSPFRESLRHVGLSGDEVKIVVERSSWCAHLQEAIPGTHEFLAKLRTRYGLGVIANQVAGTEDRLREKGLLPFFSLIVSSAEAGVAKPDPEVFRYALQQAGCPPEKAVMVGDRIDNDIRPAKLMGMKTVRVVWEFAIMAPHQQPRDEWDVADFTVTNLDELAAVLLP